MLRVSFRRIKLQKETRLRSWLAELQTRADEVRATFVDETVHHEQAFILETREGPILVYVVEVENPERGKIAYAQSRHAIDQEHKRIMKECVGEPVPIEALYDVTIHEARRDGD